MKKDKLLLPGNTDFILGDINPEGEIYGVSVYGLLKSQTVVIVGFPAAYSPVCSGSQLPGFLDKKEELYKHGIDKIVFISTNDPFVLKAFKNDLNIPEDISVLSDANKAFCKYLGLKLDASDMYLGTLSNRYAFVVDNGVITYSGIETHPLELTVSSVDSVIQHIKESGIDDSKTGMAA